MDNGPLLERDQHSFTEHLERTLQLIKPRGVVHVQQPIHLWWVYVQTPANSLLLTLVRRITS